MSWVCRLGWWVSGLNPLERSIALARWMVVLWSVVRARGRDYRCHRGFRHAPVPTPRWPVDVRSPSLARQAVIFARQHVIFSICATDSPLINWHQLQRRTKCQRDQGRSIEITVVVGHRTGGPSTVVQLFVQQHI